MKNIKITSVLFLSFFLLAGCSGIAAETLDNSQVSHSELSKETPEISEELQEEN